MRVFCVAKGAYGTVNNKIIIGEKGYRIKTSKSRYQRKSNKVCYDTECNIRLELMKTCRNARIPVTRVPSKSELGRTLGIEVDCSTVGILK